MACAEGSHTIKKTGGGCNDRWFREPQPPERQEPQPPGREPKPLTEALDGG